LSSWKSKKRALEKDCPGKKTHPDRPGCEIVQLVRQYHKNKYTEFETEGLKLEVNSMLGELVSARRETM
jgi:hypothetical protein